MIEPNASILLGYVFLAGGIALIVAGVYDWYRHRKNIKLMKLEEKKYENYT